MGISGLLPFLKKASRKSHIRNFSGQTVAVDGSCWLHKGSYGCAQKLGTGEPTIAYITYFIKYVNILKENGLRPILVFDGRSLPSKEVTNAKRREKREENRHKAKEALRVGNKREAWECFQRSIEITPAMVREVIKVLRQEKLDYIISPYESDAQLAYLSKKGIVDLVITEDSDLVLFGCPKVFFKMNANGEGVIFDQSRLHLCLNLTPEKFDFEKFRQMCIFSGCDYLESLTGIGLARAKKVFTQTTHHDLENILKQAASIVKIDITISDEYVVEFIRAENTFLYQLVFDPRSRELCPLTPYPQSINVKELFYCGAYESPKLAMDMALGNVDIKTLEKVNHFNIDDPKLGYYTEKSMWSKTYKNIRTIRQPPSIAQEQKFQGNNEISTSKKMLTVSSSHILKHHMPKLNGLIPEMKDDSDEKSDGEVYEMFHPPAAKRPCLRSFYINETSSGGELESSALGTSDSEVPSTTSSDESSMTQMQLRSRNPFVLKPEEVSTPKEGIFRINGIIQSKLLSSRRIGLSVPPHTVTKVSPKKMPTLRQSRIDLLGSKEVLVKVDKLNEKSSRSRQRQSRYFTEGAKEYQGCRNHAIFVTNEKRISF